MAFTRGKRHRESDIPPSTEIEAQYAVPTRHPSQRQSLQSLDDRYYRLDVVVDIRDVHKPAFKVRQTRENDETVNNFARIFYDGYYALGDNTISVAYIGMPPHLNKQLVSHVQNSKKFVHEGNTLRGPNLSHLSSEPSRLGKCLSKFLIHFIDGMHRASALARPLVQEKEPWPRVRLHIRKDFMSMTQLELITLGAEYNQESSATVSMTVLDRINSLVSILCSMELAVKDGDSVPGFDGWDTSRKRNKKSSTKAERLEKLTQCLRKGDLVDYALLSVYCVLNGWGSGMGKRHLDRYCSVACRIYYYRDNIKDLLSLAEKLELPLQLLTQPSVWDTFDYAEQRFVLNITRVLLDAVKTISAGSKKQRTSRNYKRKISQPPLQLSNQEEVSSALSLVKSVWRRTIAFVTSRGIDPADAAKFRVADVNHTKKRITLERYLYLEFATTDLHSLAKYIHDDSERSYWIELICTYIEEHSDLPEDPAKQQASLDAARKAEDARRKMEAAKKKEAERRASEERAKREAAEKLAEEIRKLKEAEEKEEAERQASLKAAEKAEAKRKEALALARKIEADLQAAKKEAERKAAEQITIMRAAAQAEAQRIAAENAEAERRIEQQKQERIAAEKANEKQEAELRACQARKEREAVERAEAERVQAENARAEQLLAQQRNECNAAKDAENERLATAKALTEQLLAQQRKEKEPGDEAEAQKIAAEKERAQQLAADEMLKMKSVEEAESVRLAAEKLRAEQSAEQKQRELNSLDKAETERLAAEKKESEQTVHHQGIIRDDQAEAASERITEKKRNDEEAAVNGEAEREKSEQKPEFQSGIREEAAQLSVGKSQIERLKAEGAEVRRDVEQEEEPSTEVATARAEKLSAVETDAEKKGKGEKKVQDAVNSEADQSLAAQGGDLKTSNSGHRVQVEPMLMNATADEPAQKQVHDRTAESQPEDPRLSRDENSTQKLTGMVQAEQILAQENSKTKETPCSNTETLVAEENSTENTTQEITTERGSAEKMAAPSTAGINVASEKLASTVQVRVPSAPDPDNTRCPIDESSCRQTANKSEAKGCENDKRVLEEFKDSHSNEEIKSADNTDNTTENTKKPDIKEPEAACEKNRALLSSSLSHTLRSDVIGTSPLLKTLQNDEQASNKEIRCSADDSTNARLDDERPRGVQGIRYNASTYSKAIVNMPQDSRPSNELVDENEFSVLRRSGALGQRGDYIYIQYSLPRVRNGGFRNISVISRESQHGEIITSYNGDVVELGTCATRNVNFFLDADDGAGLALKNFKLLGDLQRESPEWLYSRKMESSIENLNHFAQHNHQLLLRAMGIRPPHRSVLALPRVGIHKIRRALVGALSHIYRREIGDHMVLCGTDYLQQNLVMVFRTLRNKLDHSGFVTLPGIYMDVNLERKRENPIWSNAESGESSWLIHSHFMKDIHYLFQHMENLVPSPEQVNEMKITEEQLRTWVCSRNIHRSSERAIKNNSRLMSSLESVTRDFEWPYVENKSERLVCAKASLEASIMQIVAWLRLEFTSFDKYDSLANRKDDMNQLHCPDTGGRFITLVGKDTERQVGHLDEFIPETAEVNSYNGSLQLPSYFALVSGPLGCSLWIAPYSHCYINLSSADQITIAKTTPLYIQRIPPWSLLIKRGDLVHAGSGGKDSGGLRCLRFRMPIPRSDSCLGDDLNSSIARYYKVDPNASKLTLSDNICYI